MKLFTLQILLAVKNIWLSVVALLFAVLAWALKQWMFEIGRKRRRDYYNNNYLKSDA